MGNPISKQLGIYEPRDRQRWYVCKCEEATTETKHETGGLAESVCGVQPGDLLFKVTLLYLLVGNGVLPETGVRHGFRVCRHCHMHRLDVR